MKNKILIVAAHPDDEVLGCGGTIAKYTKSGDKAYCLFLGKGKSSRFKEKKAKTLKNEQNIFKKETQKASKFLGILEIFFENFPDQKYDTVPFLDIIKSVEKIIKKINPNIIFTHHFGDLNLDHRITFRAVLTATRPIKNCSVKELYSFEIPSSTEWNFQRKDEAFFPNIFEDISMSINKKNLAIKAYKTEMRKFPHPRSKEAILSIAKRWGSVSGFKYAEAFELIRWIK